MLTRIKPGLELVLNSKLLLRPQREALDCVQQVAAEPKLRYDQLLEPGDCLLNHNLTTFHARSPIADGPGDADRRHMLRIWIASPLGWCAVRVYHPSTEPTLSRKSDRVLFRTLSAH